MCRIALDHFFLKRLYDTWSFICSDGSIYVSGFYQEDNLFFHFGQLICGDANRFFDVIHLLVMF